CAAEDLGKDPETEIRDGRQLKEKWKDENGHEHDDTRERKEKEVSAEHTGYRSRSAHGWNNGIQIRQPVHETSDQPAEKIEKQKSDRSHSIFNVVAEDPKCPHIPDDVQPTAVQKHAREEWPVVINRKPHPLGPSRVTETGRNETEEVKHLFELMR